MFLQEDGLLQWERGGYRPEINMVIWGKSAQFLGSQHSAFGCGISWSCYFRVWLVFRNLFSWGYCSPHPIPRRMFHCKLPTPSLLSEPISCLPADGKLQLGSVVWECSFSSALSGCWWVFPVVGLCSVSLQLYFCNPCSLTGCSATTEGRSSCVDFFFPMAHNRSLSVSTESWILFICLRGLMLEAIGRLGASFCYICLSVFVLI